ncbi:MAG: S1 RNA-binding domain-containing protein [Desulfobacterales bacterium]|nr:S1 RNA-binding domain-containing protein [Desulfobacterales bacterium]
METINNAPGIGVGTKNQVNRQGGKDHARRRLDRSGTARVPGVVHISQLSKDAVNKVEDVVKEGQTVEVWVRRVKKDRIELTMIEPLALEWKEIEPDMVVKGKVVRLEIVRSICRDRCRASRHDPRQRTGARLRQDSERDREGRRRGRGQGAGCQPQEETDQVEHQSFGGRRSKSSSPAKKENRRGGKPGSRKEAAEVVQPEEPKEPELTGMQIAWQEALNRSGDGKDFKIKKNKTAVSQEQEEILNRTLKKRLPTGG